MTFSLLEQYDTWPYPDDESDATDLLAMGSMGYDIRADHALLWPERPYRADIDVLVAGCGTNEAAVLALANPKTNIVGIDISPASLARADEAKRRHGLANLTLFRHDLHHVADLDRKFDLVISTGVLHHLPKPAEAIAALGAVLRNDGAMLLSMYRRHPRIGVTIVQAALQRLGVGFSRNDIAFTRHLLAALPDEHHLFANCARDTILSGSDADIVDTFLNRHDHAFTVPELLNVVAASGLAFQCWHDNAHYYPDASVDPASAIGRRIEALPRERQWEIVELLNTMPGSHRFVLREPAFAIDLDALLSGPSTGAIMPALRAGARLVSPASQSLLHRGVHRRTLSAREADIVRRFDGTTSLAAIIAKDHPTAAVTNLMRTLWRSGFLTVST